MIDTQSKPVRPLAKTRVEMIDACGRICHVFALPRSLGQIYGLLYLAPEPLSLDNIVNLLGISKASASTGTRQLSSWGAIRQVWVPGERRDHYQAEADLGTLLRFGLSDILKPRLTSSQKRLERLSVTLSEDLTQGSVTRDEYRFCAERLKKFMLVQRKLQSLAPLAEKLF